MLYIQDQDLNFIGKSFQLVVIIAFWSRNLIDYDVGIAQTHLTKRSNSE